EATRVPFLSGRTMHSADDDVAGVPLPNAFGFHSCTTSSKNDASGCGSPSFQGGRAMPCALSTAMRRNIVAAIVDAVHELNMMHLLPPEWNHEAGTNAPRANRNKISETAGDAISSELSWEIFRALGIL
ncbi:unnamed protein product, partial [Amoebophrya sp. A25]